MFGDRAIALLKELRSLSHLPLYNVRLFSFHFCLVISLAPISENLWLVIQIPILTLAFSNCPESCRMHGEQENAIREIVHEIGALDEEIMQQMKQYAPFRCFVAFCQRSIFESCSLIAIISLACIRLIVGSNPDIALQELESEDACGLIVHSKCIMRNKRCVLAYLYVTARCAVICRFRYT